MISIHFNILHRNCKKKFNCGLPTTNMPKTGKGKRPQSEDFSTATNISGTYNQLIKTCNKLNKLTDDKYSEMYYEINQLKTENSVIDKQENGDYNSVRKIQDHGLIFGVILTSDDVMNQVLCLFRKRNRVF